MSQSLDIARSLILEPAGLGQRDLDRVVDQLLSPSVDAADLYFQTSRYESWVLEDGIIKEASYNIDQGAGLRAVSGEKTGFAYSDEIALPALLEAASSARAISRAGQDGRVKIQPVGGAPMLYPAIDPLGTLTSEQKVDLLRQVDAEARKQDPRVVEVIASLAATHDVILLAASDGSLNGDIRPLVRMNVTVIVEQGDKREQASCGGGGRRSYQWFGEDEHALEYAREAVRRALVNLEAVAAPAGDMPVVLGPGWPGVLLHEAIGHGLEGDFNRKGTSAFSGRLGERVASDLCTVVDDGTMPGRRGSLTIDDEGVPTQNTVLIENGILRNYMQDKMNARLMGMEETGNGRRESYAHLPMPRMTNTYMLAGKSDPAEIIASVEKGLYAVNFGGGQVDITSGKFVFSASEAYLIENGKVTRPVKGATLIGDGPEVLSRVSMVGNDLELDSGVGVCGKEGQSVPVGVGQPTLKIDMLTVGGTSTEGTSD
ncbi:MAG TPA: metalloprotease TldD [Chromatiales bacterium]|jgi:TldD protein|nr:metalloprotease TldD [Chromatiaceae bacterium]HIN81844.1 metalloprotease TldD [Chromatiales bacterium]HIO13871.1 metalloprotease TldD [Chromatiales bacterium]HIO54841.1 metalloprotease TldD [Chromatiales bacterium]